MKSSRPACATQEDTVSKTRVKGSQLWVRMTTNDYPPTSPTQGKSTEVNAEQNQQKGLNYAIIEFPKYSLSYTISFLLINVKVCVLMYFLKDSFFISISKQVFPGYTPTIVIVKFCFIFVFIKAKLVY
jgi:hypothetical protein